MRTVRRKHLLTFVKRWLRFRNDSQMIHLYLKGRNGEFISFVPYFINSDTIFRMIINVDIIFVLANVRIKLEYHNRELIRETRIKSKSQASLLMTYIPNNKFWHEWCVPRKVFCDRRRIMIEFIHNVDVAETLSLMLYQNILASLLGRTYKGSRIKWSWETNCDKYIVKNT